MITTIEKISKACLLVMGLISFVELVNVYTAPNTLFAALLAFTLVMYVPLMISLLLGFFWRRLFHYCYWLLTAVACAIVILILLEPDESGWRPKPNMAVLKYFRDNSKWYGFFIPVAIRPVENGSDNPKSRYDMQVIYKTSPGNKIEQSHMGKVEIDSNFHITKIYYNQPVLADTGLLKAEWGNYLYKIMEVNRVARQLSLPNIIPDPYGAASDSIDKAKSARLDVLRKNIVGRWGGLNEDRPVWWIILDSIYYYDHKRSYPIILTADSLVIVFPDSRYSLNHITVNKDTLQYKDTRGYRISAYRFRK